MKFCSILTLLLLIILAPAAFAQDQDMDGVPKPAIEKPNVPSHLGSEAPDLAIESDLESGNVMVVGFSLGAAYDNRSLYETGTGTTPSYSSDTRYFLQPSIAFQRAYSTGEWTLSYTPGVSISQHDAGNSEYTHNFAGDFNYKPSSYLQFHARQDFSLTDNPFETVGRVDLLPGLGGVFGPNYNGVLPQTRRTSLVSTADLTYRVAEHSAIGLTGNFQKYSFDATDTGTTALDFVNAEVVSGSAFFSQQFSASVTAGVQLALMDIYSTGAQTSRTQAPAAMLFFKLDPTRHLSMTLYGGPEYARTRDAVPLDTSSTATAVVNQHSWFPILGGSMLWSRGHHAFDLQGMHRIANGGGVMDAVQATYAGAAYRERLSPKLLAELSTNWSDQKGLGTLSEGNRFRSLWVGGGPVVELRRSTALRFDVAYVHQSATGIGNVPGNHFLVQGSLDYRFHKSLGD
jgi:hypothetical protein